MQRCEWRSEGRWTGSRALYVCRKVYQKRQVVESRESIVDSRRDVRWQRERNSQRWSDTKAIMASSGRNLEAIVPIAISRSSSSIDNASRRCIPSEPKTSMSNDVRLLELSLPFLRSPSRATRLSPQPEAAASDHNNRRGENKNHEYLRAQRYPKSATRGGRSRRTNAIESVD